MMWSHDVPFVCFKNQLLPRIGQKNIELELSGVVFCSGSPFSLVDTALGENCEQNCCYTLERV